MLLNLKLIAIYQLSKEDSTILLTDTLDENWPRSMDCACFLMQIKGQLNFYPVIIFLTTPPFVGKKNENLKW